jgi:hypothetical protein
LLRQNAKSATRDIRDNPEICEAALPIVYVLTDAALVAPLRTYDSDVSKLFGFCK